jgi:hypothetical protein
MSAVTEEFMSIFYKGLLLGGLLLVYATPGIAATYTDCYQKVCVIVTVPDQPVPAAESFEVVVEGYIDGASSWDTSAYQFLQNASWSYDGQHKVNAVGNVLDAKGFNWGGTFGKTYKLTREPGTYRYTFIFGSRSGQHGYYDVAVDAQVTVAAATVTVALDIHPQFCPNPLNVGKNGLLPVAIVGTGDFDVTLINPATLTLAGVLPIHSALEDVAEPYYPLTGRSGEFDCTTGGPDGLHDLTLKFRARDLVEALQALHGRPLADGEILTVELLGSMQTAEGQEVLIRGEDVVRIVKNREVQSLSGGAEMGRLSKSSRRQ